MKRILSLLSFVLMLFSASAQDVYWVFLTDKAGSTFDPYAYFDAKAIERYRQCGADLYDQSNYPLTDAYVEGVDAIATEEVGQSRWMNAIGVVATPDQIASIKALPYVSRVQMIGGGMLPASVAEAGDDSPEAAEIDSSLADQLVRMQGHLFRKAGIDGSGVRIAVLDNGFTRVNTHHAFKHVRDDGRILKTWNFPLRREDVYGWGTHGTMTFSCIAGRNNDGKDLGLATGAEFLLARTEVASEPFKEEVWWMQGMEWADRNGANIISSSLGYGKDRYYTKDMDGTAYVAKAANMAVRKGMLVVNSAGNEGDDNTWRYIITPSDADSVLCVGGIEHSLTSYNHISFASYGPTADGRQKPNVCAFAHAWAASPRNDHAYEMVYGTSFSCPLVAGFAACAWQASKGKTAMQLFDALQRSADLYPYCDYAFGYGVPQASYFVGGAGDRKGQTPTFRFERLGATSVSVIPTATAANVDVFYKDIDSEGRIITYGKRSVDLFDTAMSLDFEGGHHLVVHIGGYTADYRFDNPTEANSDSWANFRRTDPQLKYSVTDAMNHEPRKEKAAESHFETDYYFQLGLPVSFMHEGGEITSCIWSPAKRLGIRYQYKFSKAYGIGLGLEYGHVAYRYNGRRINELERYGLGMYGIVNGADRITSRKLNVGEWSAELFQRIRFLPGGVIGHKGLHWDLGVFVGYMFNDYRIAYSYDNDPIAHDRYLRLNGVEALDDQRLQWGVLTRVGYDNIAVYARGTISRLTDVQYMLPFVEVGVQLMY